MRIGLVSREYPPFFGGGIGAYIVAWSRTLAAAGHQVVVVTVSDDGTERRERDGEVVVIRLPFIRAGDWSGPHPAIATPETTAAFRTFSPVSVLSMQIAGALPRLAEEFGLDVVEFPETGALGWFALNARRTGELWPSGGPAIVTTIHSPTEWIARWNRTPLRTRADLELAAMEGDCVLWSDGLVCPSRAVSGWSQERWGLARDTIAVVPYPLGDLEPIARRAVPEDTARNGSSRRVLFVGRLEPRKGVDTLFDGFARAVGAGADLTLDLAGEDMPDPQQAERFGALRLARLPAGIGRRVRALGRVTPERVAELRAAADIAVIPAPMDNFPLTCVEAMAQGRLVVAAAAGGMAEMIRDGRDGLLFAPGDERGCAEALQRAATMGATDAVAMRRSAVDRILDVCGNARVTEQRVGLYQRAIAGRQPRTLLRERPWVVVNRGEATAEAIDRLQAAARTAGVDFAHGWVRTPANEVRSFSTPRTDLLALAGAEPGPLVVAADAAARARTARLLWQVGPEMRTQSTLIAAVSLLADGATGVVVPGVITAAPDTPAPEPDTDARAELARIRASRGWRLLQRLYDVLHILRGRGRRRR